MLNLLKADPLARDLPGADEWLSRLLKKPVTLDRTRAFLPQAVALLCSDSGLAYEVTPWEPDDEGYDGGPDENELGDSWHTDEYRSTGNYCGMVIGCDGVFDELGAILVALADVMPGDEDEIAEEFEELAERGWVGPDSQDKRDKRISDQIRGLFVGLSDAAKKALLAGLAG